MAQAAGAPRYDWVDAAKGICIILVVMMHTTLGLGEDLGREGWMHAVVAFSKPFRMPDFFLVSGLFLSRVIDRDWRTFADKRVVHFAYFYVLWLVIQSALKYGSVSGGSPAGFAAHLAHSLVEPFGTLWFIYLLAVFSVVTKLLRGLPAWMLVAAAAILESLPIHTGHVLVDEFAARWFYFVVGYLYAGHVFALAKAAADRPVLAIAGLVAWGFVNGVLALNATGLSHAPTYAELPGVSLALGLAGAAAIVTLAALLTRAGAEGPLAYCGRHSIAIYLAFFLPMAVLRILAARSGLELDVGWTAAAITAAAVVAPLVAERVVRHTPLAFLFSRPAVFRIPPRPAPPVPA